jgi:thioredoxin-like negative regulator of GroEL
VREEITRSTPKERREAAIRELENAVEAFASERYKPAAAALRKAKAASSRSATIRELLGLSAYHIGNWDEALKELRAFRRMSGETDQMPIEMDCLRALGRGKDVGKTYDLLHELGGGRDTDNEARVVYASHLVDEGLVEAAWKVVNAKLVANPPESLVRRWAVAARVAHAAGDDRAASKFLAAIRDHDAELPWLEDLEAELAT